MRGSRCAPPPPSWAPIRGERRPRPAPSRARRRRRGGLEPPRGVPPGAARRAGHRAVSRAMGAAGGVCSAGRDRRGRGAARAPRGDGPRGAPVGLVGRLQRARARSPRPGGVGGLPRGARARAGGGGGARRQRRAGGGVVAPRRRAPRRWRRAPRRAGAGLRPRGHPRRRATARPGGPARPPLAPPAPAAGVYPRRGAERPGGPPGGPRRPGDLPASAAGLGLVRETPRWRRGAHRPARLFTLCGGERIGPRGSY
jgi:hypothetical protein